VNSQSAQYWKSLSEWDLKPNGVVTAPTGLMYRENTLDSTFHRDRLFLRECYFEIYDNFVRNTLLNHVFFTGTPGIGKTMARNAMVAMQLRDGKAAKSNLIIILGKSPRGGSELEVAVMENGEIVKSMAVKSVDDIPIAEGFRVMVHTDISVGNVEGVVHVLHTKSKVTYFYYTSPNSRAWNEKTKDNGLVVFVPSLTLAEFEKYFLGVGCNGVLIERLRALEEMDLPSFDDDEDAQIDLKLRGDGDMIDFAHGDMHGSFSAKAFREVIRDEVARNGPVPRHLFLTKEGSEVWVGTLRAAVTSARFTVATIGLVESLQQDIRNKLIRTEPVKLEDGTFNYLRNSPSTWLGAEVEAMISEELYRLLKNKIMDRPFDLGQILLGRVAATD